MDIIRFRVVGLNFDRLNRGDAENGDRKLQLFSARTWFSLSNVELSHHMSTHVRDIFMFKFVVGIWITAGLILGFAVPPIVDNATGGRLMTPQIAFFHVPMAVAMEVAFILAAWNGVRWLMSRDKKFDALSLSYAEVGTVFGVIATCSGSVFAKANWNTYWSWDPQQVGILTTLLTYGALFSLRGAVEDDDKKRSLWSVYAILGLLTALFSTVIWRRLRPELESLHPKNTLVTSDPLNRFSLWFNVAGYVMLLVFVANVRARLEMAGERLKELQWA